jgi:hypothetical protein
MLRFRAHARFAAIDRPDDRTSATASALNSGECCRRCCPIGTPFARPSLACRVSTFWGKGHLLYTSPFHADTRKLMPLSRVIEARGRLEASLHSAPSACPPYPTLARPHLEWERTRRSNRRNATNTLANRCELPRVEVQLQFQRP